MANILIIDDDKIICDALSSLVKDLGHNAQYALTLEEGLTEIYKKNPDVVFLDVRLPDGNGLEALPRIQEASSSPEVIIITADGDPDGAELAIKSGAWDYIEKPASVKQLTIPLLRALRYREEKKAKKPLVALKREGIIGSGQRMKAGFDSLAQAAASEANALITGETGTGKELFAKAIHANSPRTKEKFVVVDCAALPETLVESSLFGHAKGAFTGAERSQEGLIKQADGGILFLDEVGELTMSLQKVFLRVLQERRFRPIGGKQEVESNFRLIAATNRELDKMVEEGRFRKDLLYRLRTITIELPPLRQHPEDIKELVVYHMTEICERYGTETKGLSPDFFDALTAYDWPGNVRELVNTLEGAIASARREPTLFSNHLPTRIRIQVARAAVSKSNKPPAKAIATEKTALSNTPRKFREVREAVLAEMEKNYFQDLIELTKGGIKKACEISGLSRNRLYIYLKRHKIDRSGWPR